MIVRFFIALIVSAGFFCQPVYADEKIRLDTTIIKNNTELPQVIYIVPWRDIKAEKRKEQTLTLHSLYGDLFDPVYTEKSAVAHH